MNEKKPTIKYASSFVSQNFGEYKDYHGYILWDLLNDNQEYNKLFNPKRHIDFFIFYNKDDEITVAEK